MSAPLLVLMNAHTMCVSANKDPKTVLVDYRTHFLKEAVESFDVNKEMEFKVENLSLPYPMSHFCPTFQ